MSVQSICLKGRLQRQGKLRRLSFIVFSGKKKKKERKKYQRYCNYQERLGHTVVKQNSSTCPHISRSQTLYIMKLHSFQCYKPMHDRTSSLQSYSEIQANNMIPSWRCTSGNMKSLLKQQHRKGMQNCACFFFLFVCSFCSQSIKVTHFILITVQWTELVTSSYLIPGGAEYIMVQIQLLVSVYFCHIPVVLVHRFL